MDKTKTNKMIALMKDGVDLEIAVHYVGLSLAQVFAWIAIGKTEQAKIAGGVGADKSRAAELKLWEDVTQARAYSLAQAQMSIRAAATEDWKAAAWWLEKQMPEKFGKQAQQLKSSDEPEALESGE